MGKKRSRYVARSEAGKGWQIWNTKMQKWWGNWFRAYPEKLLLELNDQKRPPEIASLTKELQKLDS